MKNEKNAGLNIDKLIDEIEKIRDILEQKKEQIKKNDPIKGKEIIGQISECRAYLNILKSNFRNEQYAPVIEKLKASQPQLIKNIATLKEQIAKEQNAKIPEFLKQLKKLLPSPFNGLF